MNSSLGGREGQLTFPYVFNKIGIAAVVGNDVGDDLPQILLRRRRVLGDLVSDPVALNLIDAPILDGSVKTKRQSQLIFHGEPLHVAEGSIKIVFRALELHRLDLVVLS